MLSGTVAAAHKEMTALQAAPVAPAATASPFDFSQLVSGALPPLTTASTGAIPSTNTTDVAALKAKQRHDIAAATDAAAGQVPQALLSTPPQSAAQPTAATAAATPSSSTQTLATSAAAAAVAAATHPATPATPTSGASAQETAGGAGGQNGQTAPLPLGAADLEARVAIGAQSYLSQPSSVLAGPWHHGGEPGAATPQAPSGADQNTSAGAAGPDNPPPGQAGLDAKTAGAVASAAATAATGGGSAAAAKPDAATATAAAALPDATASTAQNFTLPGTTSTTPATAATPGSTAALPTTAAHILPAYEQVAVNLKQAAQSGADHIEIQLKPASLGAIAVKLDVTHDGRITAVISADRSDTLHMLRQDSAGLQQALRDAGLQADSGSLSFNLRGDGQSFAQNSQNSAPAQTGSSAAEPVQLATSNTAAARPRRHDGALDIEV